jgi:flagellar hook-basal body complex protein FliE
MMMPAIPPVGGNLPGSQLLAVQNHLSQATQSLQLSGGVSFSQTLAGVQPGRSMAGEFNNVMMNTLNQVNETVKAPDVLLEEYLRGGPVDIHDVMIAGQQSELAVSMTSRIITKAIQAYERITQIQV